jgi:hypothetical protein
VKSRILTKRLIENLDMNVLGALYLLENGFDPKDHCYSVTWSRYRSNLRAAGIDVEKVLSEARS